MDDKTIQQYCIEINDYFSAAIADPLKLMTKREDGFGWEIDHKGSIMYIYLIQNQNAWSFRVALPILYVPKNNLEEFYKYCLEINNLLWGCALSVKSNILNITTVRPLNELPLDKVGIVINRVNYGADKMIEKLTAEFKLKKYSV